MDTVIETTDRVRFERKAAISNRELVHRIKNSYALVKAIVRQIARRATSVEDLREKLDARLSDMGHAQDILSLRANSRATVGEIVSHVQDRMDNFGDRIESSGPPVPLTDEETFALTLALFELATNSTKYGALSVDDGRVVVGWELDSARHDDVFSLIWREHDGPPVAPPRERGFGSFLVKQLLAAEFGGKVTVDYPQSGVVCRLTTRRVKSLAS